MTSTKLLAKHFAGALALSGVLLAAPHAAHAQAGAVTGGYFTAPDANKDHITLSVSNFSAIDFTDLTLTALLPADSFNSAVSDSYNFGSVPASGSLDLDLSVLPDFGADPAHTFPGIAPLTFTVTAKQGGTLLTSTFSQSSNASGGYVQFEGIGEGTSDPYLAVAPTRIGLLAPVPEASTLVSAGLFLLALGGLTLRARLRA